MEKRDRDIGSTRSSYGWAGLPKELLEMIGTRLDTRIDVYRFRAICTSWRSVVPLSHHKTSLSQQLNFPRPISATAFLSPVTICRLEDERRASACLIKITESTSGKMRITHPLSSNTHLSKSPLNPSKTVNISNLRIVEFCKGYQLKFKTKLSGVLVKKVFLFGKIGILVIYDEGKLMYWGFGDENWTILGNEGTRYDDIAVNNKGQFYVVDSLGTISWVDNKTMNLIQYSPTLFGFGHLKNLVVSNEQLFVVDTYFEEQLMQKPMAFERVDFRVYKLDEEWGNWVEVKSLGDWIFVLGRDVCFSVSMKHEFPGCERNCIYFCDSKMEDNHLSSEWRWYFPRVFEFGDRRRMKTVDCVPSHRRLFSVPMNFAHLTSLPASTSGV